MPIRNKNTIFAVRKLEKYADGDADYKRLDNLLNLKYPGFDSFEILATVKKGHPELSLGNMYRTFTEDMADDVCSMVKSTTQGKELRDWNVLLGNFDEVINFSSIKDREGLLRYANNSNSYIGQLTAFASDNTKLKDYLESRLGNYWKNKLKDFGEA